MRIAAIRGCNLASIEGAFEVALDEGPMAGAGVFAISGPVGAGKTTILDAMCLALFDRTPRLARGSHRLRLVDGADEVGVTDPRSLLRRGAAEARAEVDFVGRNGRRWRATWAVRRARDRVDGRLQAQTMELRDLAGGTVVSGNKTEVLARIEAELGLSWDQFCRSVLLAQGDFAAFLQAKPQDRAELLERMTGTAVYAQIGRASHERAGAEQRALEALEARQGGVSALGGSERSALQERLQELQREQQAVATRRDACRRELDRHEARARRQVGMRAATERLAAAERDRAEAAPLRAALAEIVRLAPVRPLLEAADRARGAVREVVRRVETAVAAHRAAGEAEGAARLVLEAAVARLAAAEAERIRLAPELRRSRDLDARRAHADQVAAEAGRAHEAAVQISQRRQAEVSALEQEMAGQQALLSEGRRRLEGRSDLARLVAEWPRWRAELATHARLAEAAAGAARDQAGAEADRVRLRRDLAEAEPRLAELQRRGAEAGEALAEAVAALGGDLAEAQRERARREQGARVLLAMEGLVARLGEQRASLDDAAGARAAAARARSAAERACGAARAEAVGVAAALDEAGAALRRLEAAEDLAARRPELLVDGEPCPLCGAGEHPYAHAAVHALSEVVEQQRRRVQALRDRQRQLAGEEQGQLVLAAEGARNERSAEGRIASAEEAIAGIERQWSEARERLVGLDGESGEVPERPEAEAAELLQSLSAANTARLGRIARCEIEVMAARASVDELRVAERVSERAVRELHAALATREVGLAALRERLADLRGERQRIVDGLAVVLGEQPRWREELASDAAAFAGRCADAVAQLEQWRDQVRACEAGLEQRARKLDVARALAEESARDARVRLAELEAAQAGVDELVEARGSVLGGRAADEVERSLEHAVGLAREACAAADGAHRQARERHREALVAAQAAEAEAMRARAVEEGADRALHEALVRFAITEEGARERLAPAESGEPGGVGWEEAARARLAEVDQGLVAARSGLEALLMAERAGEGGPEALRPVDEVRAELEQAERAEEAVGQDRLEALSRLRADDQARAQLTEIQPAIERQRRRADLWREMAGLIGSHDGSRFRVFAQGLTLDALVAHANVHLRDLAPRYRLARVPGQDLDLQIVDRDLANDVRGVNSLSGGETFLVSLALALGLSSLASHDVRIGSLFVDEGFGSLDPDTLEIALGTLDALQSTGRRVGLVSHVPGLAERIGVRVEVVPTSAGRSIVRIVA